MCIRDRGVFGAIVISLALVLVKVISVPPVKVIASFVELLLARFIFVVAAGTSKVYVVPANKLGVICTLAVPLYPTKYDMSDKDDAVVN